MLEKMKKELQAMAEADEAVKTSQLYIWKTDPNINIIKIYKNS